MRLLLTLATTLGVSGCEMLDHVTCAPRQLVESCLQESFAASSTGFGPYCTALNEWQRYHGQYFGGGPPMPNRPSPEEAHALAVK